MLNFTVGPVQSNEAVRGIGAEQVPYFRTAEFSGLMLENEQMMKELAGAGEDARCVFITGSGTASMEAVVMNVLSREDRVLVVDGGSFGHRFVQMLDLHRIEHTTITLAAGKALTEEMLLPYEGAGYTAFLVNTHETSTGVLYDLPMISGFCRRNRLLLIADSISSFLADPFHMEELGADVMITGSQKALACPPGISVIVMSRRAVDRVMDHTCVCMYLDLKSALVDGERGQTPFTPAVGTLRQIHIRLKEIVSNGGTAGEIRKIAALASYFRRRIEEEKLPFEIFSEAMSNAVTPLHPTTASATDIFLKLKDEYGIWVCPNGGELSETVFRVGHIGDLTTSDYDVLIEAMLDLKKRGII
ncbi:MAG: alanine--glyoxylate aminotransferase family protein [Sarcina sp.]|nr:alanine--glyoxylate aminotransferase family protein [Sarcina sp.]